jgi:hypothetical protein
MLLYVWINPLFLPTAAFVRPFIAARTRSLSRPRRRQERLEIDPILDKIAKKGMNSLSPEEKKVLDEVSGKYQRREQTKKPESGLAI